MKPTRNTCHHELMLIFTFTILKSSNLMNCMSGLCVTGCILLTCYLVYSECCLLVFQLTCTFLSLNLNSAFEYFYRY